MELSIWIGFILPNKVLILYSKSGIKKMNINYHTNNSEKVSVKNRGKGLY
jgi:hypothetical protein